MAVSHTSKSIVCVIRCVLFFFWKKIVKLMVHLIFINHYDKPPHPTYALSMAIHLVCCDAREFALSRYQPTGDEL